MKKSKDFFVRNKWATHTYALEIEELDDVVTDKNDDKHWGYHLLMDFSGCNQRIDSKEAVADFINAIVKEIKMEKLGDMLMFKIDTDDPRKGKGITAVQCIQDSSITFHSDLKGMSVYFDIFSCAPFDVKKAVQFVKEQFQPAKFACKFIYRDADP